MSFDGFDAFDTALSEALQGSENPKDDFAERVMAQVRCTPQKKRLSVKAVGLLAACCAAVLLAVPFLSGGLGNIAKSGEAEAPAAAEDTDRMMANGFAEETYALSDEVNGGMLRQEKKTSTDLFASTAPAESSIVAEREFPDAEEKDGAIGNLCTENAASLPTVSIDDAQQRAAAMALLEARGCRCEGGYMLTAEDVAAVCEAIAELDLPNGGCFLTDEGA